MPNKKQPNRLFYTVKLSSGLLKEHKYKLEIDFEECIRNGLIVSLADSQMLKTIRDVTGQAIDRKQLEEWYEERDRIKKRKNSKENRARIKELQKAIWHMMYIPDYITVVMDNIKEYERIFKKGFVFNGKLFKRLGCSASQARVNTVAFCNMEIRDEVIRRLDNGRDMNHILAPSKYNAYFGLYSSAGKPVTFPRFCVMPDYESNMLVDVDYVIEEDEFSDDTIEPRTLDLAFNRFDGSGLISPQMAEQWGKDLGEDYTPCQFCIRWAFTKGMVNEFDFVEWCRDENDGNYIVTDVYGNQRDLREIDVILTEGQVKMWDSWTSQAEIERNARENGIEFFVTKYVARKDKNASTMNYQFLQTLDLTDDMIKSICQDTVDYIQGVSYDNIYYTELFLMGENSTVDSLQRFMESSDNYWLKSLILNNNLLYDKYSKEKVRDMIIRRIELACLGKILVQGQFSVIVADSYAFMEWITGHPVKGLLKDGEFYCPYWVDRDVEVIAAGRSPMTHFSEWCVEKNKYKLDSEYRDAEGLERTTVITPNGFPDDDAEVVRKIKKYFKYSYTGVITNVHGYYTMNFSGSDFDMDLAFTSNNRDIIFGRMRDYRVVTYDVRKPVKKKFTEDDLFTVDIFSFNSLIGVCTNKGTVTIALMPLFEKGSRERKLLEDRVKMTCAAQSRQIDKTKLGAAVKETPKIWMTYQKATKDDTPEQIKEKMFYNSLLVDRKPYFMRYKYAHLNKELNQYVKKANENCITRFKMPLKDLLALEKSDPESLTPEQKTFLYYHNKFMPVVDSDCVMNKICHYIESIDFEIKKKVRSSQGFNYENLMSPNFILDRKLLKQIKEIVEDNVQLWRQLLVRKNSLGIGVYSNPNIENENAKRFDENLKTDKELKFQVLKSQLEEICSNEERLTNHLIYLFYVEKPTLNKSYLWNLAGKQIYENIKSKTRSFYFPFKNPSGSLKFMYDNYSIERVVLEEWEREGENESIIKVDSEAVIEAQSEVEEKEDCEHE